MKKILEGKNLVITILVIVILGLILFNSKNKLLRSEDGFSGIENSITVLSKDIEFYKYLNIYKSLLPEEKFKVVDDRITKISEETEKEDSEIQNTVILTLVSEFLNDSEARKAILELKAEVSNLIKDSKTDADTLFTKNTECAKLTSNIKDGLVKKYKPSNSVTEKEELNFIFYSPTLNTCVYTTNYTYSYSSCLAGKCDFYSKYSYKIYDVSSDKHLGDYPSYYTSDYPYITGERAGMETKKGVTDYKKFILENSGYNAKLLKDVN